MAPESARAPVAEARYALIVRWGWPLLISVLLAVGVLLAWTDSAALRGVFPDPFPEVRPRGLLRVAPIPGSGPLSVTGQGTVVLTGTNTFTGGVTITAGTVGITSLAALGPTLPRQFYGPVAVPPLVLPGQVHQLPLDLE